MTTNTAALKAKLTKTKSRVGFDSAGKPATITTPVWGTDLAAAAAAEDWNAALAAAKFLHLHGIVEQIQSVMA